MNTYKTIPFHILLIRSLAKDFEARKIDWRELYDILFVEGTDIYREFVVTLINAGISLDSNVNYKDSIENTQHAVVIFEEDEERRVLTNLKYREDFKIPKTVTVNVLLGRLGYTIVKEPKKVKINK
ncbi:hypothetical protein MYMA111404_02925 [Mycoplasma marinum]|uniref:Uncharacterized protein n=1 Tax=Mycoplasma marinum TaxID=1937190 RepID=A0A4V6N9K3_9MOLU|nr:hypothetical protein [Mycoplasma marinum]TCG11288.1 hypothetical protein C4B24_02475 [Mycoplasma marinum]